MKRVAVLRDVAFSPHAVENDRAVMEEVAARMGVSEMVDENQLLQMDRQHLFDDTALFLSMARKPMTLKCLKEKCNQGAVVINSPWGVERCARNVWQEVMRQHQWPLPPERGQYGHWVKRADAAAQRADDVMFVPPQEDVAHAVEKFHARGVTELTVSAHVPGDVVKFYGVAKTGFFRYYYPTDDGMTKFGWEKINGEARHFCFKVENLSHITEQLAMELGVMVYGGDCIVDENGQYYIIDFNDWPSFSRCRKEAAQAIAKLAENTLKMTI